MDMLAEHRWHLGQCYWSLLSTRRGTPCCLCSPQMQMLRATSGAYESSLAAGSFDSPGQLADMQLVWLVAGPALLVQYKYTVVINNGMRGPFVAGTQERHWTQPLTSLLSDMVSMRPGSGCPQLGIAGTAMHCSVAAFIFCSTPVCGIMSDHSALPAGCHAGIGELGRQHQSMHHILEVPAGEGGGSLHLL